MRRDETFKAFVCSALVCISSIQTAFSQSSKGVWDARTGSSSSSAEVNRQTTGQQPVFIYREISRGQAYNRQMRTGAQASTSNRSAQSSRPNYPAGTYSQPVKEQSTRSTVSDYYERTRDGRRYTVHLPRSYKGDRAYPVVLLFHGLGMNGNMMRGLTLMDMTAEQHGFITVYPDANGGSWNDGIQSSGVDDVAFVSDMLDSISAKFKIDSRRVYACGISNGGYFVERLACELPNRIAAIGVIAATGSSSVCARCSLHVRMPVVFFLGTDDPLVRREGESKELGKLGEAIGLADMGITNLSGSMAKFSGMMSSDEAPEFWAKSNSCSAHPREEVLPDRDTRDGCKVKRETYTGEADVVVYTIEGGGHNWPGGAGFVARDIIGRTTGDISASEILWQFFERHYR